MLNVSNIMTRELVTVSAGDCVGRAAALMEQFKIGGLPVVEDGKLVGIITSRDIRRCHPNRLVADAMSKKVITVTRESSLWEAKELLERYEIERLVVVDGNRPVGIVAKSQLYAELGKHVDALTGLDRAVFLQRKAAELLQEGKEIAVIFLDLDNFGTIDKKLGHVLGDEVLRRVAEVLKGLIEEGTDYLCRYAGDEFAVVTIRPFEEARKLAWQMVAALAEEKWPGGIKITGSVGVAGGRRRSSRDEGNESCTVSDLINMASLASTRAKREGKRVVVADEVEMRSKG
ncbi:CBS domain-containing protein [Calderihabitans maritimus]|uniref:Diguanylate cyclase n=1 Tax=Calderihabitans maritimus TaxID=1246530 RepID=A0A1Z5HPY6_9FIRM|nr:CBS domain-containing protein [Calderihabitans maritimus]GAW91427.1 diguanylate cyclase [Calderihabitans maritimus]